MAHYLLLLWTVFLLLAHCVACLWWSIGISDFNARIYTGRHPWVHPERILSASGARALLHPSVASLGMRYWTCMYLTR